jgi:hypothetical protein
MKGLDPSLELVTERQGGVNRGQVAIDACQRNKKLSE